jgi:hypothetical protein
MAKQARYTAQCPPWKATPEQRARIDAEALARDLDIADLMREMTDARYGLVNGESPAPGADVSATAG